MNRFRNCTWPGVKYDIPTNLIVLQELFDKGVIIFHRQNKWSNILFNTDSKVRFKTPCFYSRQIKNVGLRGVTNLLISWLTTKSNESNSHLQFYQGMHPPGSISTWIIYSDICLKTNSLLWGCQKKHIYRLYSVCYD